MRSPIEEASALAGMLRAASIRSAARDLLVRFELILALALAALAVWMTSVLALPHLAAACPVIRFVGIAAFCAALAASAWRAAAGRVPERSLAALWERAFPGFDGCLLVAVEAARGVPVPEEILAICSRRAREAVRVMHVPPPVPEMSPAGRTHVFLSMMFAVHLLMAAYLQADYFRALAICLWAPPPAPAAPLSIAEVRPGDVEVVEGDPVGISALVRPADSVSSAFVETDSWLGGEGVRVRMRRGEGAADPGGADRWTVRFPAVLKSFRYRIAAEPERPAAMWPFRPADRPAEAVVSAWHEVRAGATLKAIGFRAAVSPPPYTGEAERVSESPFFEALWGSSVRIEVVASREDAEGAFVPSWGPPVLLVPASGAAEPPPPVRRNPGAGSGREADPGGKAGARVGGAQPAGRKRMSVEFQAGRGGEWEIRLSPGRTGGGGGAGGVGGAGNAVVIRGAVTVRMDRPPAVFCRIPDGAAIGERGLPVELRVSDDFGISDAALIVSKSGGVSAAYDVPAVRGRRELARTMYIPGEDLVPGETVEYVLQARDNFPDAPQVARTEPKKFTVPKAESGGPMFGGRRSLKRPGRVGEGLREPGGGGAAGGAGGAGGTAGGGAGTGRSGGGSGGAGEGGNAGTQRKTLRSGPERLEDVKNAGGETSPGGGDDRRRQGGSPGAAGSPSEYEAPSAGSPEDDRRRASGGKDGRGGGGADGTGSGGRSPAAGGEGRADGNDKGSGGGKGGAEGTGASGSGGGTDTPGGSRGADKAGRAGGATGGAAGSGKAGGGSGPGGSGGAGGPGEPNGSDGSESAGGGRGGAGGEGAPGEAGGGGGSGSARGGAPQPTAGEAGGGTGESPTPGSPHKRARDAGPKTGSETGIGSPVPETVDASRLRSLDNVSVEEAAKYAGDGRVKDLRRDFGGEKGKDAAAVGGAPSAPKGRFDPGRAAKGPDGGPDVDREKSGASGKGGSPEADVARKLRTLSREYRDLAEQYMKRMRGR